MEVILRSKGLRKSFYQPEQVNILDGIDLEVQRGTSVAITGRSGQGKSTLLQILGTLEKPCAGILEIVGQQVSLFNKTTIRNRHIAFVFQSFHLLEDETALENVLMPAKIARKSTFKGSSAFQKGMHLLAQVGLEERAHFPVKLLSGGEKQRVAFARALCNDPDLIFADEPSGNLDRQTAAMIHDLLLDFPKQGKAVILVTHDPQLAEKCDIHYRLEQGKLQHGI